MNETYNTETYDTKTHSQQSQSKQNHPNDYENLSPNPFLQNTERNHIIHSAYQILSAFIEQCVIEIDFFSFYETNCSLQAQLCALLLIFMFLPSIDSKYASKT